MSTDLVLYDGVCGLCNRAVQFALERDRRAHFRFASLQSDIASRVLGRYGHDPKELDTLYVVSDYGGPRERVLDRAKAILFVASRLGGMMWFARLLLFVPSFLLNPIYRFVATRRYGWFGKSDTCLIPRPEHRERFLDHPP